MRILSLAACAVTLSVLFPVVLPAASPSLSITNYHMVGSEVRMTRTTSLFTYSADLQNTGQAQPSITATVTSNSPAIVVQSGFGSLHFPPVAANATVTSTDTFQVVVDRSVNPDFSSLVWAFSTPVADAGANQTAAVGSTVTLNGSKSTNPSGIGTLTYSWQFAAGGRPAGSNAVLQNPTSVSPTFVVDVPGTYTITLTVSNGAGVNSASVVVTTTNTPPVANAGPNQTIKAGATVHLDGSASHDVDGDPLTYLWSLVAAPPGTTATLNNPTTVNPTFTADKVGTYKAQLIVNDGHANSNPAQVTISSTDTAPVANAGPAQSVKIGAVVQLNGSQSTDVDGDPLTFHWSFNQVPTGSTAALSNPTIVNPTFTADLAGTYVAQLIVNDGFDDSAPSTVTITTNVILAPTANAGSGQTVTHGAVVHLTGSGTDPQNLPLTFRWSLSKPAGSNATLAGANTATPSFTADVPGSYVAQLIVNNGSLDSAPSTVTITTTNTAPVANAGTPQLVPAGTTVTLDGSASSDADHDPLTYAWSLTVRPAGSAATLLSPTIVSPTFVADVAGAYVAQLIVSDPFTSSAPATVTINATSSGITLTPNPLNILRNSTGTLTVSIGVAAGPGGQDITLGVFDTSVATAPVKVTIPANATSTTAVVTPAGVGTTTIIASAPGSGLQPGSTTVNVTLPSISLSLSNNTVGVSKSVTGTITLSAPAPAGGVTIGLSADNSGVFTFPASVNIASGTTATFTITASKAGTATITASSPNYQSGSASLTAASQGAITLQSGVSVVNLQSVTLGVGLVSAAPTGGVTITLTSSDTSKLTVTPSVFIAGGNVAPDISAQVTGVNFGVATVTATASGFTGASADVNVIPGLVISPSSLPVGTVNVLYPTTTVTATGGTPPYTKSVTNLPAGLNFDPATGTINGKPTAAGTATVTITDSSTPALKGTLTLTVNPSPLVVTPADPLPSGVAGQAYALVNISASGGTPPYILSAANLPNGLNFNPTTGDLSGTPTVPGVGTITIKDSGTQSTTRTVTITASSLLVSPTSLPDGTQNVAYPPVTVSATGGTPPYTLSSSNLPAGLAFNTTTGVLNGIPTASGTGTITVTDAGVGAAKQTKTLTVKIAPPPLAIVPLTLPDATVGAPYGPVTISATGGVTPYTFTSTAVPAGLNFNTSTGVLSGTPTIAGSLTITVTDSTPGTPQTQSVKLTINAGTLVVTPNSLPVGTAGSAYPSTTLVPSGGTAPYTFSSTTLPAGIVFNTSTGVLSGTPTAPGTATITVKDSATPTPQHVDLMLTINAGPLVVTPAQAQLLPGAVTLAYPNTTFAASGGTAPYTFTASGLPNGMAFNTATGVLSGTPTAAGTITITVKDSGAGAQQQTVTRTVTISPQLQFSPSTLPVGTAGTLYPNTTVTVSGGNGPYVLSATGLPSGLSFNASTGAISGTPGTAGTATITATDSTSPVHLTSSLTLTINPAQQQLTVVTQTLPDGIQTKAYPNNSLVATGGTAPYTWSLLSGTLPLGLSLNPSGRIFGTVDPSAVTTSFVLGVSDSSTPAKTGTSVPLTIAIHPNTPYVTITGATIGKDLETSLAVTLNNFTGSTNVTISSDNPNVLFSKFAARACDNNTGVCTTASQSITFSGVTSTFIVYAEALASSGTANITAHSSTAGSADGTSTVTLTPSAFVLSGPNGVGASLLLNQNSVTPLNVVAKQVDNAGNVGATQQVRTEFFTTCSPQPCVTNPLTVTLSNTNTAAGTVPPSVQFGGGDDTVSVNFTSATSVSTQTNTIVTANEPTGFSTPAGNANVIPITVQPTSITPGNASVGKNLETTTQVTLGAKVTQTTPVTITSSDPSKVLFSTTPGGTGQASIIMNVVCGGQGGCASATQPFWVYGLDSTGTVGYTAQAPGIGTATGLITLTPSGFELDNPFNGVAGQDFHTVTGAPPNIMNVDAVQLNSAGNVLGVQAIAGGLSVSVALTSSNQSVGTIVSPVTITGGNAVGQTTFTPVGAGSTLLSVVEPSGYSTPVGAASLTATVSSPNILLNSGYLIGQDLEQQATFFLGAAAPPSGAQVLLTVTSGAAQLSATPTGQGQTSISVTVNSGGISGTYYIYGRGSVGAVTISASSPGYNSATATDNLTASGIVVYDPNLGIDPQMGSFPISTSVGNNNTFVTVATAAVDPNTLHYIGVQALAPTPNGQSLQAAVHSSNAGVGTIDTPATIAIGATSSAVHFTPLASGTTSISAQANGPSNFVTPSSGGTVNVIVQ